MKSANIISTSVNGGMTRATVEITGDNDETYTVENLGPLSIFDSSTLWQELVRYDTAYWAGKGLQNCDSLPVGPLTPPDGV